MQTQALKHYPFGPVVAPTNRANQNQEVGEQIRSNEITFQIIIFRVTDILNPIATGIYYYQTAYYRYGLHYYDVVQHSTVPDAFFHVCLACMESIRFFISHTPPDLSKY